jgi:hypothetical protein
MRLSVWRLASFRAKSLQSMRRILIERRMDSAFCDCTQNDTLRFAQNDDGASVPVKG